MAGKYAEIIPQLPRYESPDRSYQDKVKECQSHILTPVQPDGISDETRIKNAQAFLHEGLSKLNAALLLLQYGPQGRRHASVFALYYKELRVMKDTMAAQESEVNLAIAAYEALVVDQYENEDASNIRLASGGSVGVQWEPYAQVVDKEAHRLWAIKEGLERSMSLPWQTTNALTKEALVAGQEPPAGIKATGKPKVVLRKA